jgi:cardiolipin synthase A/B
VIRIQLPAIPSWRRTRFRLAERYLRYVTGPERIRPYNRIVPLRGGAETFPRMLAAIRSAKRNVHLEMYILRADLVGQEFQKALIDSALAGVEVRLMYDGLGSFGLPAWYTDELRAVGVELVEYAPIAPWRQRWGLNKRDHQKILIVDNQLAYTGGINIGEEYAPVEWGGGGWFDLNAEVDGPAVYDLALYFRKTWIASGGAPFPGPELPRGEPRTSEHTVAVQVISNVGMRSRSHMRHAYMHAIRRADDSISIMNAYFIPDRGLRRVFARAVRRGVEVRVIVPSVSDVRAVYWASRHLYSRLMRSGVRIFEWPERMMHAKSGVIDGVWSTIGSYNLDRRSLLHNLEVGLILIDRGLGERMQRDFDAALAGCKEVRLAEWEQRSWWQKCCEWFCFRLRYWL